MFKKRKLLLMSKAPITAELWSLTFMEYCIMKTLYCTTTYLCIFFLLVRLRLQCRFGSYAVQSMQFLLLWGCSLCCNEDAVFVERMQSIMLWSRVCSLGCYAAVVHPSVIECSLKYSVRAVTQLNECSPCCYSAVRMQSFLSCSGECSSVARQICSCYRVL